MAAHHCASPSNTTPEVGQGAVFLMRQEVASGFVFLTCVSGLRAHGHRLKIFYFVFTFMFKAILDVNERLLGLFCKTFHNLHFSVTNIHGTSIMPDIMLKFGKQISLEPEQLQVMICSNQIKCVC